VDGRNKSGHDDGRVLLPAHFLFVIAGLDPAIHAASPHVKRVSMDRRVKPGGDETGESSILAFG
jgi:hypothetical protein